MSPCNSGKYCNSVTLLYKSSEQEHGRHPSDSVACLEYHRVVRVSPTLLTHSCERCVKVILQQCFPMHGCRLQRHAAVTSASCKAAFTSQHNARQRTVPRGACVVLRIVNVC